MHAKAPEPTEVEILHKISGTCYFTQTVNVALFGA